MNLAIYFMAYTCTALLSFSQTSFDLTASKAQWPADVHKVRKIKKNILEHA